MARMLPTAELFAWYVTTSGDSATVFSLTTRCA